MKKTLLETEGTISQMRSGYDNSSKINFSEQQLHNYLTGYWQNRIIFYL